MQAFDRQHTRTWCSPYLRGLKKWVPALQARLQDLLSRTEEHFWRTRAIQTFLVLWLVYAHANWLVKHDTSPFALTDAVFSYLTSVLQRWVWPLSWAAPCNTKPSARTTPSQARTRIWRRPWCFIVLTAKLVNIMRTIPLLLIQASIPSHWMFKMSRIVPRHDDEHWRGKQMQLLTLLFIQF